ncbi:UNKNOWN [Stylonychia lemnae]|uniref:Uncharacterized protein n=1 Tax=Stylonychia lemnae TaxID=5949 RepID=A0A078AY74_STYLE|nr:UNKNOWN [Stylonychia lemnae]|eukprot:CDW85743.1 UNKNOWN [Stylonychia lemnae]
MHINAATTTMFEWKITIFVLLVFVTIVLIVLVMIVIMFVQKIEERACVFVFFSVVKIMCEYRRNLYQFLSESIAAYDLKQQKYDHKFFHSIKGTKQIIS